MSTKQIRQALPSDAADMHACVTAAYTHYIERMGKPPGPMLDDYSAVIRDHLAYVLTSDTHIAGILVLMRKRDVMLLDNIAIDPAYQGQGLGRQLMQLAERKAAELGYAAIELYTNELMTENIAFYIRLGFVETERRLEKGYQRVYMRKQLEK